MDKRKLDMLEPNLDLNQKGGVFFGLGNFPDPKNLEEAIKVLSGITRRSLYKLIFDWTQEKSKGILSLTRKARLKLEAFKRFVDKNNDNANPEQFNLNMLNKKEYKQKHFTRILLGMLYTYLIQSSLDQTNIDNFAKEVHKIIIPKDFVVNTSAKGTPEYKDEKIRKKETDAKVIDQVKKYILTPGGVFNDKISIILELYRLLTIGLAEDIRKLEEANSERRAASKEKINEYERKIAESRLKESSLSGLSTKDALKKTELNKVIQEIRNRFNLINNDIRGIYKSIGELTPATGADGSTLDVNNDTKIKKVNDIITKINETIQKARELKQFLETPLFVRLYTNFKSDIDDAIELLSFHNLAPSPRPPGGATNTINELSTFRKLIDDLIKSLSFKAKELQAKYLANPFASPNKFGLTNIQEGLLEAPDNPGNHTKQLDKVGNIRNLDQVLRKPEDAKLTPTESTGLKFLGDDLGKLLRVLCTLTFGQLKYLQKFVNSNFFLNLVIEVLQYQNEPDSYVILCNDVFITIINILNDNKDDYLDPNNLESIINQIRRLQQLDPRNIMLENLINYIKTKDAIRKIATEALTFAQQANKYAKAAEEEAEEAEGSDLARQAAEQAKAAADAAAAAQNADSIADALTALQYAQDNSGNALYFRAAVKNQIAIKYFREEQYEDAAQAFTNVANFNRYASTLTNNYDIKALCNNAATRAEQAKQAAREQRVREQRVREEREQAQREQAQAQAQAQAQRVREELEAAIREARGAATAAHQAAQAAEVAAAEAAEAAKAAGASGAGVEAATARQTSRVAAEAAEAARVAARQAGEAAVEAAGASGASEAEAAIQAAHQAAEAAYQAAQAAEAATEAAIAATQAAEAATQAARAAAAARASVEEAKTNKAKQHKKKDKAKGVEEQGIEEAAVTGNLSKSSLMSLGAFSFAGGRSKSKFSHKKHNHLSGKNRKRTFKRLHKKHKTNKNRNSNSNNIRKRTQKRN